MPEVVARHRIIHREDAKSDRVDIAAGSRVNLDREHVERLRASGAIHSPQEAERRQREDEESVLERDEIAGRDPGADAEARAEAERAAAATAAAGNGEGNITREPQPRGADDEPL